MNNLDDALRYARSGFLVIPCRLDGKPMSRKAFNEATTDPAVITQWWADHPEALVGFLTGISNNIFVLDVDLYDGSETLLKLQQEHGQLPTTTCQRTGDGGYQYFFKHPRIKVKNYNKRLGLGLKICGDGGYVIVPSSATPHRWISTEPIAEAPNWLMSLITDVEGYTHYSDVVTSFCKKQGLRLRRFQSIRDEKKFFYELTPEDGGRHDS